MSHFLLFALLAPVASALIKILPLGDSITYGCGSSSALPPKWDVSCGPDAGGYRAPLYHALRDTGFKDASGNATFQMVGNQNSGPSDIPVSQRSHEGHPGWTVPQIIGIQQKWMPLSPDFILIHLATNDCGQGHPAEEILANMTTLLANIKVGLPSATTIVASVINFGANFTPPGCTGYNAGLPALVAAAAQGGQKVVFNDMNRLSGWCQTTQAGFPCT